MKTQSDNKDPQQEEIWRVTSVENHGDHEFISTQTEVSWTWMSSWLDTLKDKTKENIVVSLETDDENSFTHTNVLESVDDPQNTILEQPIDQLFQKYWTDKKPHPLYVSWVAKNFRALLWKWVIETIDIPQKLNKREKEITSETKYEIWDTLRFYLISTELSEHFPNKLNDLLQEEWFKDFYDKDSLEIKKAKMMNLSSFNENWVDKDHIIDTVVKSLPSWKSALAVYRDWKLFMTSYVSIWTYWRKTRMWQYEITWRFPYKRSAKYENSPMPFALNYSWWYYFHQWNVTGTPLSHWCVRLPWVYASVLYSLVKDKEHVDVFIDKNLYKRE